MTAFFLWLQSLSSKNRLIEALTADRNAWRELAEKLLLQQADSNNRLLVAKGIPSVDVKSPAAPHPSQPDTLPDAYDGGKWELEDERAEIEEKAREALVKPGLLDWYVEAALHEPETFQPVVDRIKELTRR